MASLVHGLTSVLSLDFSCGSRLAWRPFISPHCSIYRYFIKFLRYQLTGRSSMIGTGTLMTTHYTLLLFVSSNSQGSMCSLHLRNLQALFSLRGGIGVGSSPNLATKHTVYELWPDRYFGSDLRATVSSFTMPLTGSVIAVTQTSVATPSRFLGTGRRKLVRGGSGGYFLSAS